MLYIVGPAGGVVVTKATNDLYDAAKRMLLEGRRREPTPGRDTGFVIYGPDGEELRRWTVREGDKDP